MVFDYKEVPWSGNTDLNAGVGDIIIGGDKALSKHLYYNTNTCHEATHQIEDIFAVRSNTNGIKSLDVPREHKCK